MKNLTMFLLLIMSFQVYAFESMPNDTVTLTTYNAVPGQTDDTPDITASGFKLDLINPFKHKIIAVSRDLLKIYSYGDKVRITGTKIYDGIYYIEDTMAKRWVKRIDILININGYHTRLEQIIITKI